MKILFATIILASAVSHYSVLAQRFSGESPVSGTGVWRAAEGILPERMIAQGEKNHFPLYRTLWKRDEGDFLVCLRYPGGELFGTPYDVAVLNTNMQIVQHGEITAYQDDTPYCIAEVMTDDKELPEGLRNKWLLAVGFWDNHFQEYMRLVHAGGAANSPQNVEATLEKLPSEFYFELVRWGGAPVQPKYGAGNLTHIPRLKIRWIERGTDVLLQAAQDPGKPYKFEMPKAALERARMNAEPSGPANASRPIRSETNRTPAAAGSPR